MGGKPETLLGKGLSRSYPAKASFKLRLQIQKKKQVELGTFSGVDTTI